MGYQVTAPLVQARKADGSHVHIDEGGFLPDDIDDMQLEQLLESKMVVEADEPPAEVDGKPATSRRKK